MEPDVRELRRSLLRWYTETKRDLPFRRTRDPYAILVAEVMLQRTRIAAGLPYYERFLAAFPSVQDLAAASESDVLRLWEGLGFYGRARNLHRAAQAIAGRTDGGFPNAFEELRSLPGIGAYSAGAVASIAFGESVPAVDGNAVRVLARLFRVEGDPTRGAARRRILDLARSLVPDRSPGDWNQAVMELGATVCTPRAPRCGSCPVAGGCLALAGDVVTAIPARRSSRKVPTERVVFAVVSREGAVLLVRRPAGLHAGLLALPGGSLDVGEAEEDAVRRHLEALGLRPVSVDPLGPVRQAFSHLRWEGTAYRVETQGTASRGDWIPARSLEEVPLIPLHRRLLHRAMS